MRSSACSCATICTRVSSENKNNFIVSDQIIYIRSTNTSKGHYESVGVCDDAKSDVGCA